MSVRVDLGPRNPIFKVQGSKNRDVGPDPKKTCKKCYIPKPALLMISDGFQGGPQGVPGTGAVWGPPLAFRGPPRAPGGFEGGELMVFDGLLMVEPTKRGPGAPISPSRGGGSNEIICSQPVAASLL